MSHVRNGQVPEEHVSSPEHQAWLKERRAQPPCDPAPHGAAMNAEELLKKESKSDAELIAWLAVTRVCRGVPIGVVLALPDSERTPERVYESLLSEARALWDWQHNHVDRRTRERRLTSAR
jgi:hypothetical protein